MRILVDKLPETAKDCLFVKRNVEYGYICPFQHRTCSKFYDEWIECPCLKEIRKAKKEEGAGSGEQCGSA